METTLHRQLKSHYVEDAARQEVVVDGYRIDAVRSDQLIEIQQGSLGAIRDKVRELLDRHDVLVVKPLVARKFLIKHKARKGPVISSRYSPRRESPCHIFDDFVHFVGVFPHPRLTVELVLTEQEEHRVLEPRRRWRSKGYRVLDRRLRSIEGRIPLSTAGDLLSLLPERFQDAKRAAEFTTADLAEAAGIPRWLAQKAAYCLRKSGAVVMTGKRGNALVYQLATQAGRAA